MNVRITLILLLLLNAGTLLAQVKVGDAPNAIDSSSLLELQSADKVFVLTRVTNGQMNLITPLPGALVYNTDQNCVFQYDGTVWQSLCSISSTETLTFIVDNNDGTFTYTNEEGTAVRINKAQLQDLGNGTFTFDNGNGSPINFDGTDDQDATEVNLNAPIDVDGDSNLETTVQEAIQDISAAVSADGDTITGNEILDATDGTLIRNGAGTTTNPYTLDVATGGISTTEIANGTIASEDIAPNAINAATINADVAGTGLTQNATTGALEVDVTAINGDGNITSSDLTVGGDTNALLGDVTLEIAPNAVGTTEIADDAVTNAQIADDAIQTENIADDAVTAATINSDIAGTGLTQNASGALEVDGTAITGDGNIT
ncbi:hypothetical protein J8281_08070, partial [Aquimarina sp. U1-2]|uniref:hypothetical protein n=1 Tax=Aquimarina sp. U1-2 TaxID=2823141 RepID=UPI001AED022E